MHWRSGFRRLAKATAIAYWLLAVVVVIADFDSQMILARNRDEAEPFVAALGQSLAHLGIWALVYVGLALAARGVRWVARGFLDGERAAPKA